MTHSYSYYIYIYIASLEVLNSHHGENADVIGAVSPKPFVAPNGIVMKQEEH